MTLLPLFTSGPDPITLALLGVTAINAALAFVVIRAARREENRVFALLGTSVALWALTNALFRSTGSLGLATLWAQLAYFAALSTGAAFLSLSWIYPRPSSGSSHRPVPKALAQKTILWLTAAAITLSVFVPGFVVRNVDVATQSIVTGPGIDLIALFMLTTSVTAFSIFFGHQKHLRRRARAQARYVLFGSFLTATFGLTFNLAFPLAGDYRFVWIGPLSSLFFVGFSGYSMVAHHLFDVRLLIRRTLVYTLLLAALAGAFAALEKGLEYLLRPLLGGGGGFATDLLAALVISFAVDPLKQYLHRVAAKALFHGEPTGSEED